MNPSTVELLTRVANALDTVPDNHVVHKATEDLFERVVEICQLVVDHMGRTQAAETELANLHMMSRLN